MHSQGPCERHRIKNLGETGAWAYPGTAQIFWITPASGTGNATNFKFRTHIHGIDRNKGPLKISGENSRGRTAGTLESFQGTHIGRIAQSSLQQLSFLV